MELNWQCVACGVSMPFDAGAYVQTCGNCRSQLDGGGTVGMLRPRTALPRMVRLLELEVPEVRQPRVAVVHPNQVELLDADALDKLYPSKGKPMFLDLRSGVHWP